MRRRRNGVIARDDTFEMAENDAAYALSGEAMLRRGAYGVRGDARRCSATYVLRSCWQ